MNSILPFFKNHQATLPSWAKLACLLAAQQMNSASVERLFSFLKQAFNETQTSSLSDYVQAVVLRRYNKRRGRADPEAII
jgi:hAT family C-terminal dimerisation region